MRLETTGPWPSAFVRAGDDWVSLHSRRDPVAEAERQLAQQFPDGLPPTIAVVGLGLGFLLDALDRRQFAGRVAAAEPLPALAEALRQRTVTRAWIADGRLALVTAPAFAGSADLWKAFGEPAAQPQVLVHPVLARACPAESEAARTVLERAAFAATANASAKRENAARYLLNTLRNAAAIAAGGDVGALADLTPGVPAVVVAAGPSLDRNLADIAAHRDRALVIAVDTALRPLLMAGIHPDLVVGVDPTEANARHLTDLPPCLETYLVAEGSLDPEALRHFEGRTFFFRVSDHHPWPWLREQGCDRGRLRAFGSVLTTAFDLALVMGCDPIVFAGADLAFTDGRPYARGTTYEEDWRRGERAGCPIDEQWATALAAWPPLEEAGIDGAVVRTAPHLRAFRDWIVEQAGRHTGRTIVNASAGGILRGPGILARGLDETIANLPVRVVDARRLIAGAFVRGATPRTLTPNPSATVVREWMAFGGPSVTADAVAAALGGPVAAVRQEAEGYNTVAGRIHDACHALGLPTLRTDELVHLVGEAATRAPARVIAVGDGLEAAALAVSLAAGSETRLLLDDVRQADALARALGVPANRLATRAAGDRASLVVLRCGPADDAATLVRTALNMVDVGGALAILDHTGAPDRVVVRRAVRAVLLERPDLGVVDRDFWARDTFVIWLETLRNRAGGVDLEKWSDASAAAALAITPLLVEACGPSSVLDVGAGAGHWLDAFESAGVTDLHGVESPDYLGAAGGTPHRLVSSAVLPNLDAPVKTDLCLCLGIIQRWPLDQAERVVRACTQASNTVAFSMAVPGVGLASYRNDQPWAHWHAVFADCGFVCCDEIRPGIEARHAAARTSFDFVVLYRRLSTGLQMRDAYLAAMRRIDDLVEQRTFRWRQAHTAATAVTRRSRMPIPAWRMAAGVGAGARTFRFRTDVAPAVLSSPGAAQVFEGTSRLFAAPAGLPAPEWGNGWYRLDGEELTFTARDGSDPRHNGRVYTVELPSYLALLESLPSAQRREYDL